MGQVHRLPTQSDEHPATMPDHPATVRALESARCALCGRTLSARALHYRVVSPQKCEMMTVCYTCRRAALGEGYRPAE